MLDFPTLLFSVGAMPFFASRTFVAAFCIVGLARMQTEGFLVWISDGSYRLDLGLRFPEWLVSDQALGLLFLLAMAESMADKNPDARFLLSQFDPLTKGLVNYVFNNVSLAASFVTVATIATVQAHQAGFGGALWALIPAAGVSVIASLRRRVLSFLTELDEDDDLGLRKLISWAEDGWVAVGTLLVVFLPLIALAVAGLTVAGLWFVQFVLERRAERQKVPCSQCGERIFPSAPACFACRTAVARPMAVGALGQPTAKPVGDLDEHRLRLLSKKRCLMCASRLRHKRLRQNCETCGSEMLPSSAWADHYLAYVDGKLPRTLMVCAGLSLVPIVGLVPGIIYYRLGLVSSLRVYLPPTTGCLTRWLVRMANLLLLALQWIPLLGAITLPAMCYLNYRIYRNALLGHRRQCFAPDSVPSHA